MKAQQTLAVVILDSPQASSQIAIPVGELSLTSGLGQMALVSSVLCPRLPN